MWILVPNFRDLDGWDAVSGFVGAFLGLTLASVVGVHGDRLVFAAFGVGFLPMYLRRVLWPRVEGKPAVVSNHNVGTLLLMGVGVLVLLLGALAASLFAAAAATKPDSVPVGVMVLPAGVIVLGSVLIALGWKLSRPRR